MGAACCTMERSGPGADDECKQIGMDAAHKEAWDVITEPGLSKVLKSNPSLVTRAAKRNLREECDHGNEPACDERPRFEFIPGAIPQDELKDIQDFAENNLSLDESSAYFMRRRKAIAFVFVLNGRVYSLEQNYFVQNETYNDFSGGVRRPFAKIPDSVLQNQLRKVVLRFVAHNNIPDKAIMIIQVQTSEVDGAKKDEFRRQLSITGQGIHTDGHEKAMLVCVRRKNVSGAENRYFGDLDGNDPLCQPRILQEGDMTFFKDNELYHYVSPAGPADATEDMARTMLLMHYPAEEVLTGETSPKNTQGRRNSFVQLRTISSFQEAAVAA